MKFVFFGLLFLYGVCSKFTNSEFWPITISKTWFTPTTFEMSMVQKPLLTMMLSLFHLLPFNDIQHLIAVKIVFSLIGIAGIIFYSKYILKLTSKDDSDWNLICIISIVLLCISPNFLKFFFSVRSDQMAFCFFAIFLYLHKSSRKMLSLVPLFLIPATGVKEILFLVPGLICIFWDQKFRLTRKQIIYSLLVGSSVFVWIIALNIPFLHYIFDANNNSSGSGLNKLTLTDIATESPALIATLISVILIFSLKKSQFYKEAVVSVILAVITLINPQMYYFFLASTIPIVYIPVFTLENMLGTNKALHWTPIALLIVANFYVAFTYRFSPMSPITRQIIYIQQAGQIVSDNSLSYLDGAGLLPRQKFIPCFASPEDANSNESCFTQIESASPDAVIVTNRLSILGQRLFDELPKNYTQVLANLWIKNSKMNRTIQDKIDLSGASGVPMIIF